jgi:small subunit ribosomal protein S8
MLNDPIADMLTRMRNANLQKHRYVDVRKSKMIQAILSVLKEEGFVKEFQMLEEEPMIRVYLKFDEDREPLLKGMKRVSTPGRRIYVKWPEVPLIRRGIGIAIVSTSKGIKSGFDARKEKVGGELICTVW